MRKTLKQWKVSATFQFLGSLKVKHKMSFFIFKPVPARRPGLTRCPAARPSSSPAGPPRAPALSTGAGTLPRGDPRLPSRGRVGRGLRGCGPSGSAMPSPDFSSKLADSRAGLRPKEGFSWAHFVDLSPLLPPPAPSPLACHPSKDGEPAPWLPAPQEGPAHSPND